MDRDTSLRNLSAVQDRLDYCSKAGRMIWSRTAQDAGRETLDLALMTLRQLEQAKQILTRMVEMQAFSP